MDGAFEVVLTTYYLPSYQNQRELYDYYCHNQYTKILCYGIRTGVRRGGVESTGWWFPISKLTLRQTYHVPYVVGLLLRHPNIKVAKHTK